MSVFMFLLYFCHWRTHELNRLVTSRCHVWHIYFNLLLEEIKTDLFVLLSHRRLLRFVTCPVFKLVPYVC